MVGAVVGILVLLMIVSLFLLAPPGTSTLPKWALSSRG